MSTSSPTHAPKLGTELTLRGILLGIVITLVFTAANVYFGLKAGLTFATSIPAAVIAMALLRKAAGNSIGETNIVQTIASSAGTLFSSSTASSSSASLSNMSVASADQAMASIDVVDAALLTVNDERANLGAFQNRIDATISNLESSIENLTMAESRVRDADVAIEASQLARSLVLVEAGVAVMAQANQSPRLALRLLGIAA